MAKVNVQCMCDVFALAAEQVVYQLLVTDCCSLQCPEYPDNVYQVQVTSHQSSDFPSCGKENSQIDTNGSVGLRFICPLQALILILSRVLKLTLSLILYIIVLYLAYVLRLRVV